MGGWSLCARYQMARSATALPTQRCTQSGLSQRGVSGSASGLGSGGSGRSAQAARSGAAQGTYQNEA
jgi:hypothetical protein